MMDGGPHHLSLRRRLLLIAVLIVSLMPLLFLRLEVASQLASALALPLSVLLVTLAAVPSVHESERPIPWRKYLVIGATVVAAVGGLGVSYAVWQNTRDVPVELSVVDGPAAHWTHGSSALLSVPGTPPARDHLLLVVLLENIHKTGDCERTAMLELTPILDDRPRGSLTGAVGKEVDVPLVGAAREAKIRVVLHYEEGNRSCEVRLHVGKAVLHD